jgi:hypothetical protein
VRVLKHPINLRLVAAMSAYAILAILAGFTLSGNIRLGTWVIIGYFAFRTWLVVLKSRED